MKILNIILGLIIYLGLCTNLAFAAETNYTYTNQEQDKSGLLHYDSRYYDPDLGRFLQPDSIDAPNKYAYVSNNPVNKIDPTGHWDNSTNSDIFGGNRIPSWQMDNTYQSPNTILSINNRATYYGNFESVDGITLNKNALFSLDNMQTNMSVYANYKPYTPYVNATKEVLIEFMGLDSEAGVLGMISPIRKIPHSQRELWKLIT